MAGTLYIVATPIGNLEDITLRALRVLKEVDLIAAEDTRRTRALLSHYGIRTPLTSYHEHNERAKAAALAARLQRGEKIALVSDAGTPTLSDPGYRLVRQAAQEEIPIVPIPGPSAVTALLSVSGLATDRFVFEGFLPAKKGERRERLGGLRGERRTLVFYEAPHRLRETLTDLLDVLGDREAVLGREITKIYEEFIHGRLRDLMAWVESKEPRGEVALAVQGSGEEARPSEDLIRAEVERLLREGLRVKEIAQLLGEKFSCPKREVYRLAVERKH